MKDDLTIIPKNSYFCISSGCYSDYSLHGMFLANEDIDISLLIEQYKQLEPEGGKAEYTKARSYWNYPISDLWKAYSSWKHDFYKWIIENNSRLFTRIPYYEWNIGDYEFDGEVNLSDNAMFIGNNGGVY